MLRGYKAPVKKLPPAKKKVKALVKKSVNGKKKNWRGVKDASKFKFI